MEGLELFTPTVSQDGSSSESSESDGEGVGDGNYHRGKVVGAGESTWRRASHRGQRSHVAEDEKEEEPLNVDDVDDDRDFEIEKVGWCLLETRMHCFCNNNILYEFFPGQKIFFANFTTCIHCQKYYLVKFLMIWQPLPY